MVVPGYGLEGCFLMKQKGHHGKTLERNMVLSQFVTQNISAEHGSIFIFNTELLLMSMESSLRSN